MPRLLRVSLADLQTARTSKPALSYTSQSPSPMPRFAPVMTMSPASCGMHAVWQHTACPHIVMRNEPLSPASGLDVLICKQLQDNRAPEVAVAASSTVNPL